MFLVIFAMFLTKNKTAMTLDILICTIDEGIEKVPNVLIPKEEGIRYVISMQYTDESFLATIPEVLKERDDVTLLTLKGRGLSRNRNNAIAHATGDILLIADDDNRYTSAQLHKVIEVHEDDIDYDVILFRANLDKHYPSKIETYQNAMADGYYPTSSEISFKNGIGIEFDERFGLGSDAFVCGEESVFLKDCEDNGLTIICYPYKIVDTVSLSTNNFVGNRDLQIAKGAVFHYIFGRREALWRIIKEAIYHAVHSYANPFTIFYFMMKGLRRVGKK